MPDANAVLIGLSPNRPHHTQYVPAHSEQRGELRMGVHDKLNSQVRQPKVGATR